MAYFVIVGQLTDFLTIILASNLVAKAFAFFFFFCFLTIFDIFDATP